MMINDDHSLQSYCPALRHQSSNHCSHSVPTFEGQDHAATILVRQTTQGFKFKWRQLQGAARDGHSIATLPAATVTKQITHRLLKKTTVTMHTTHSLLINSYNSDHLAQREKQTIVATLFSRFPRACMLPKPMQCTAQLHTRLMNVAAGLKKLHQLQCDKVRNNVRNWQTVPN